MKKYFVILVFLVVIISCEEISSDSFWTKFRYSDIISKKIDQGPYGGTTEIHWKVAKKFSTKDVSQYAKAHGWKLVNKTNADLNFSNQILERRFDKTGIENKTILYFKSNLLTVDEDENLETQINCFAIIDSLSNELIIYHCWGDF
ncbi:MAG: hypothetical protein PSV16_12270 [Flavobacterium sp.]|nr:hypothetical protein [Flavobacterium sp.]